MKMEVDVLKAAENYLSYDRSKDGYIYFRRFLESQKTAYKLNQMYQNGFYAESSVCVRFLTSGNKISCECKVTKTKVNILAFFMQPQTHYQLIGKARKRKLPKSVRNQFADKKENEGFELIVNGKQIELKLVKNGKIQYQFANPKQEMLEVILFLPQHAEAGIRRIISNGEVIYCEKKAGKILALGDSITSGCRAQYASSSYAVNLANAFDLEIVNQGVPGYTFQPSSLWGLEKISFQPVMITVAYGTNDWNFASDEQHVNRNVKEFFQRLNKIFPHVPKVVITPIWRADENDISNYGTLSSIRQYIRERAEEMENVLVISGEQLLSCELRWLRDGYVHPDDEGQKRYAESVVEIVQSYKCFIRDN